MVKLQAGLEVSARSRRCAQCAGQVATVTAANGAHNAPLQLHDEQSQLDAQSLNETRLETEALRDQLAQAQRHHHAAAAAKEEEQARARAAERANPLAAKLQPGQPAAPA